MSFSKLKSLHKKLNWDNEKERAKFLRQFSTLVVNWNGQFPNLRDIFRKEEIDRLLTESVMSDDKAILSQAIVEFVISTGYTDEPDTDEDGKLVSRRTTAIHCAAKSDITMAAFRLFKIYNRFDVNYSDESGYTHFHAACEAGFYEFVEKFLEHGHDPNCLVTETGDSPLHLTPAPSLIMKSNIIQKLLESGANPNLVNKDGLTPLHILCKVHIRNDLVKMLFQFSKVPVQVDAQDNLGRTPLQWAVANFEPKIVDMLLDHGADLSSFVFPTEDYFGYVLGAESKFKWTDVKLLASGVLATVECLEKRGYKVSRSDARTVMKFFSVHRLFEISVDNGTSMFCIASSDFKEMIRSNMKEAMITPSLSFEGLAQLGPEKAAQLVTLSDCYDAACGEKSYLLEDIRACFQNLCKILLRKIFRRWAVDFFVELTGHQLPILCCEKIIDLLMNEDLYRVCLAVTD